MAVPYLHMSNLEETQLRYSGTKGALSNAISEERLFVLNIEELAKRITNYDFLVSFGIH